MRQSSSAIVDATLSSLFRLGKPVSLLLEVEDKAQLEGCPTLSVT